MIPPLPPTFDAALRDVRADKASFRRAAASRLSEPPDGRRLEAIEGLRALARDPDGEVRALAFESLGLLQATDVVETLLLGFEDSYPAARQAAVMALGRIDPDQARDRVAALLRDPRPDMRFCALWTLSLLGADQASRIASALDDRDPEVRLAAAQCLGELDASEFAGRLSPLLDDPDTDVRFGAAATLASFGDARAAPLLRAALRQPEHALTAAIGLGDLRDRGSRNDLARLAKSWFRSPIKRAAAARALVLLGDSEGERVLAKLVRSWRIEARQYATELVGELGLVNLVPDLARNLRRSSEGEQRVIREALQALAPKSSKARALLASVRPADHPG